MEDQLKRSRTIDYSQKCLNCSGFEEKIDNKNGDKINEKIAEKRRQDLLLIIKEKVNRIQNQNRDECDYEKLFEELKYEFTEYVLKYEYNREYSLSVELAIWLEKKRYPEKITPLNDIIREFLSEKNLSSR